MTKLEVAIAFCGLYEAELLGSLMLQHWKHPQANDRELLNHLVENAAEILVRSQRGEQFLQDLSPEDMNFVAAFWYAEFASVADSTDLVAEQRRDWLTVVRRALPSCFCDPGDLL